MSQSRTHSAPGFTLIEIMLALLVISIGMVSVIGVLGSSLDTGAKSQEDIKAVAFSDMILNYCHAEGFDALNTEGGLNLINANGLSETLSLNTVSTYSGSIPASGGSLDQEYTLSYRMSIADQPNTKIIHLEVWPGISTDTEEPLHFYTEVYNWRRTP